MGVEIVVLRLEAHVRISLLHPILSTEMKVWILTVCQFRNSRNLAWAISKPQVTQAPFYPMASVVNGMNVCRRRTRNETLHCAIYQIYVQCMISQEYIKCTISTEYIMFTTWIQLHWGDLLCQVRMLCVQQNQGLLSAIALQQNCPICGKHKMMQVCKGNIWNIAWLKKTVPTYKPDIFGINKVKTF